jgi:hypothetical protein
VTKAQQTQGRRQAADTPARQWGSGSSEKAEAAAAYPGIRVAKAVEIPDDGYPLVVSWNIARGATTLALDDNAGNVTITPSAVLEPIGDLGMTRDQNHLVYANPQHKRFHSLTLHGLQMTGDGNPVYKKWADFATPTTDLKILRLVVSTRASSSAQWMPLFAIPSVPARGAIPEMFTGASFSNEVLTFPYALNGQICLTLYEHDNPEDFAEVRCEASSVSATVEIVPVDLELRGPAGNVIWSFPGEYLSTAQAAQPSLRVPIELALKSDLPAALAANRALRAEFRIKGKAAHEAVILSFPTPHGALLRQHAGLIHCDLAGDPVQLPLDGELDAHAPASVSGGMSVRYLGMRILTELSDPLPAPGEAIEGAVVRDAAVLRAFPPAGFAGVSVGRIGIVGRAPEDCELEAQLLRMKGNVPGDPLGPPGRLVVAKSDTIATAWIDLPVTDPVDDPLVLSLRAIRGRFFWAHTAASTGATQVPRVRIAVRDPDPGGRPLMLGGGTLLAVDAVAIDLASQAFPAAQFRSTIPMLSSDLFLGVDISDLTMRYVRP